MNDFETIRENWDDILKNMKEEHDILPVSFDTWLKPLRLFDFINSQLLILVPEEGYTERVLAINTPSVVVDGVKPSVALFAALNTSDLQFV